MTYPRTELTTVDDWAGPLGGRHAFDEDAVLTPIFHALTRGGWRRRQHESAMRQPSAEPADPVAAFRRDPLTAPIPVQALIPAPTRARRATREVPRVDGGRHHRRREALSA